MAEKKAAPKAKDNKNNYVDPVLGWCLFWGALVVVAIISLIVLL